MRFSTGRRALSRTLAVAALAAGLSLGGGQAAKAVTLTWDITGGTNGAGDFSGSFDFDADTGIYSNVNVSVSGGASLSAQVFSFVTTTTVGAPSASLSSFGTLASGAMTGGYNLGIQWSSPLSNAGGTTAAAVAALWDCVDAGCTYGAATSVITLRPSTSVTARPLEIAPVPLPAAAPMLLAGLAGFGLMARRKRA